MSSFSCAPSFPSVGSRISPYHPQPVLHLVMTSVQRKSVEGSASAKGFASREGEDEKRSQVEDDVVSTVDSYEGDEALKLVGRERTAEFSEEYNRKLRRKLVRSEAAMRGLGNSDVYTGLSDTASLCRGVLHAVPVGHSVISTVYLSLTQLLKGQDITELC